MYLADKIYGHAAIKQPQDKIKMAAKGSNMQCSFSTLRALASRPIRQSGRRTLSVWRAVWGLNNSFTLSISPCSAACNMLCLLLISVVLHVKSCESAAASRRGIITSASDAEACPDNEPNSMQRSIQLQAHQLASKRFQSQKMGNVQGGAPVTVDEEVAARHPSSLWTLHEGRTKTDNKLVSVFRFSKTSAIANTSDLGQKAMVAMKKYRHPHILAFVVRRGLFLWVEPPHSSFAGLDGNS